MVQVAQSWRLTLTGENQMSPGIRKTLSHCVINCSAVSHCPTSSQPRACVTQCELPGLYFMSYWCLKQQNLSGPTPLCCFNTFDTSQIYRLKALREYVSHCSSRGYDKKLKLIDVWWETSRRNMSVFGSRCFWEWSEDSESFLCCLSLWISFERLLLHAVCQYMDLISASELEHIRLDLYIGLVPIFYLKCDGADVFSTVVVASTVKNVTYCNAEMSQIAGLFNSLCSAPRHLPQRIASDRGGEQTRSVSASHTSAVCIRGADELRSGPRPVSFYTAVLQAGTQRHVDKKCNLYVMSVRCSPSSENNAETCVLLFNPLNKLKKKAPAH